MQLCMSLAEQALFKSALSCAKSYFEFGSGGSTVLAAQTVKGPVYSVESDQVWISKVEGLSGLSEHERKFIFTDIGPTGEWGVPLRKHGEVNYLNYHDNVWNEVDREFDFYLIDGRFRVSCFCQSLLRAPINAVLAIHDYRSRDHYHVVEPLVKRVAEAEDLTLFQRRSDVSFREINDVLRHYALVAQ